MRVVFIGAGAVFGYHSQQFCQAAPKGSQFYVVEPDDENAHFSKMERLSLQGAVKIADLVIVMTPSFVRWAVCEPFIEAGIPIVVEKPLTIHFDEIALFEEAAKSEWICPVVNIRQVKKVEDIKAQFPIPTHVRSWKTRYRPVEYYDDWHGKWATDGGVLAQQGFHCLDLVVWFGGEIEAVRADGLNLKHQIQCEDTAWVDIQFSNGCVGRVDCTTAGEPMDNHAGLTVSNGTETVETKGGMFAGGTPGHTILARRVFQALAEDTEPPITVTSMVPSLYALHAAYASMARGGEWVKLGARSQLGR